MTMEQLNDIMPEQEKNTEQFLKPYPSNQEEENLKYILA